MPRLTLEHRILRERRLKFLRRKRLDMLRKQAFKHLLCKLKYELNVAEVSVSGNSLPQPLGAKSLVPTRVRCARPLKNDDLSRSCCAGYAPAFFGFDHSFPLDREARTPHPRSLGFADKRPFF
jgi:hypothetical protein